MIGLLNPYGLAAIFAIGVGIGGTGGYVWEHNQVLKLEHSIDKQKIEAAATLANETTKIAIAEETQRNLNLEMDKAHESFISTANSLDIKRSDAINKLLYTRRWASSNCPTTKNKSTSDIHTNEEEFTWVSRKFLTFLGEESKRADLDGNDKNTLIDFVIRDNCGVKNVK